MFELVHINQIFLNTTTLALAWFLLAFVVAVIVIRKYRPKRELQALAIIFLLTAAIGTILYSFCKPSIEEIAVFFALNISASLSYLIIHTAIESDSPSMLLVLHLWRVKECSLEDAQELLNKNDPLTNRADKLSRSILTIHTKNGLRASLLGKLLVYSVKFLRNISGR